MPAPMSTGQVQEKEKKKSSKKRRHDNQSQVDVADNHAQNLQVKNDCQDSEHRERKRRKKERDDRGENNNSREGAVTTPAPGGPNGVAETARASTLNGHFEEPEAEEPARETASSAKAKSARLDDKDHARREKEERRRQRAEQRARKEERREKRRQSHGESSQDNVNDNAAASRANVISLDGEANGLVTSKVEHDTGAEEKRKETTKERKGENDIYEGGVDSDTVGLAGDGNGIVSMAAGEAEALEDAKIKRKIEKAQAKKERRRQREAERSNEKTQGQTVREPTVVEPPEEDETDKGVAEEKHKREIFAALDKRRDDRLALYQDEAYLKEHTPFAEATSSLLLPLAPQAFSYPLEGLCAEHISPLLMTYYPPLKGILLSYDEPRLSQRPNISTPYLPKPEPLLETNDASSSSSSDSDASESPTAWSAQPLSNARQVDEYAPPFIWLTATYTLLRPQRGVIMHGTVQVQNPSWLGLVCYNWFNAGVPAERLPKFWHWVDRAPTKQQTQDAMEVDDGEEEALDSTGFWVDEVGEPVTGVVYFRLRDFEHQPSSERDSGFVSFEGTMLSENEDRKLDKALIKAAREGQKSGR